MSLALEQELLQLRRENTGLMDQLETVYAELAEVVKLSRFETDTAYSELRRNLSEQERRVQELLKLGEIGKVLSSELKFDVLINVLMEQARDLVAYDAGCFMTVRSEGRYEIVAERGNIGGAAGKIVKVNAFEGDVLIIDDFEAARPGMETLRLIPEARSGVVVAVGRESYGLLVMNSVGDAIFRDQSRMLLQAFASQASISLENARLYKNLEKTLIGVMISLITALEAKDQYTEGHSQRVAWYAVVIGRRLGLGEQQLESLHRSGLIHDIGKIGVGEGIIGKKGKLAPDEITQMNLHPILGESIARPIALLESSLPAIRCHHERYDGQGYPGGLRGEEIPIEARILLVADAYDAITSSRPYRNAKTPAESLKEIIKNSGTQFDPEVVAALEESFEEIVGEQYVEREPVSKL